MDVDLLARLVAHAPGQRRSVGNLLQKLVADGLDRLDDELALLEVQRNHMKVLAELNPREARMYAERQRVFLARLHGLAHSRLPPLPPSLRRRLTHKPRKT